MILSHAAWLRQFGGDAAAIGRSVTINGEPVTIVGIMPRSFEIFGLPSDIYMPFRNLPASAKPFGPQSDRRRATQVRRHA